MKLNGKVESILPSGSKSITIYDTNTSFIAGGNNWPLSSLTGLGTYGGGLYGPGILRMIFRANGNPNIVGTMDWGSIIPGGQSVSFGTDILNSIQITIQKQINDSEWVNLVQNATIWDRSKGSTFYRSNDPTAGVLLSHYDNTYYTSRISLYNLASSFVFADMPPDTARIIIYYRSFDSATGPYQVTEAVPMLSENGRVIDNWFKFNLPLAEDVAIYNFHYFAQNDEGKTVSHRSGFIEEFSDQYFAYSYFSASENFPVGATGFGVITSSGLEILDQSQATLLKLRYRIKGSSSAWSEVQLTPAQLLDTVTPGFFRFLYASFFAVGNNYELDLQAYDANNDLVNHIRADFTYDMNGTAAISDFAAYESLPTTIRFDLPQQAEKLQLKYRSAGSNGSYTTIDILPVNGLFYWDASLLVSNSATSYDYEILLTAYDSNNQTLQTATASLRLGADAKILSATTTNSDSQLEWVIRDVWKDSSWVHRSKGYNAFGEIIQETDALGHTTEYTYNTLGLLSADIAPETNIILANGAVQRARPTIHYIHDLNGKLIAVTDANGKINTQAWISGGEEGKVIFERHADGGIRTYGFDIFGNRRYVIDEIDQRTDYSYDAEGRITRIDQPQRLNGAPATRAYDIYVYDAAGQRIKHTNALGDTEKTDYDSLGRITRQTSYLGRNTLYSYSYLNNIASIGGLKIGGWQTTATNADGRTSIDQKDIFGNLTWHKDLGDHVFNYRYSYGGKLIGQTSLSGDYVPTGITFGSLGPVFSGQTITYSYYSDGSIQQIKDLSRGGAGAAGITFYDYDAEGNRIIEGYLKAGIRSHARTTYDELNRISSIVDTRATISYEYDAVGNKRHMLSIYDIDGASQTEDYWYAYDAMNRFTVSMGSLSGIRGATGTTIEKGSTGVSIAYDLAGQRKQVINGSDGSVEDYTYSADGYLEDAKINGILRARRQSDLLGRVTAYTEYQADGVTVSYSRNSSYDTDSRILSETGIDSSSGTVKNYSNTYYYYASRNANGSDNTGTVSQTGHGELARIYNNNAGSTLNTWYNYAYWDDAKAQAITAQAYDPALGGNNAYWKPGYSELTYDVNGHLMRAEDRHGNRTLSYITDAQGIILRREERTGGTLVQSRDIYYRPITVRIGGTTTQQRYYYYNGIRVGDVGNADAQQVDYAQALAGRQVDKKDYKENTPVTSADYDQSYQAVGPDYPGSTAGIHIVSQGDTLQDIAAQVWGDRAMWYLIADANGLTSGQDLITGQTLVIPNKITNVHNNTGTFRVYNPNEAMGDVTPTIPDKIDVPPPVPKKKKKGKCGGMGGIIVAVVTIVVAVIAQRYELIPQVIQSMGPAATAAAAAGIGNIAGQATGNVIGVQKGFNVRSFGTAVVSAGVTQGALGTVDNPTAFGSTLSSAVGGGYGAVAARAVVGNVVYQGLGNATGAQKGFSWSSVAVSGIAAAGGAALTDQLGMTTTNANGITRPLSTTLGNDFGIAAANAGVNALTQLAIRGGRINWQQVATDTITGFLQNAMTSASLKEAENKLAEKYKLSLVRKDDQRFLSHMQAMQRGENISDEDRYWAATFGMKQLGASQEDIASNLAYQKQQGLYPDISSAEYQARMGYQSPFDETMPQFTQPEVLVMGHSLKDAVALGSAKIDTIAIGAGSLVHDAIGAIEQRPWLRYSVETLDIIAAPVAYAARKVIDGTYIGNKLEEAKEYLFNQASGLFGRVGYDDESSLYGGTGIFAALGVGVSGAKGLLNDVRNIAQVVQNKLQGLARERLTKVELQQQYPNASVQTERALRNSDGKRAIDPLSGTGRNIDHVVIQNGKVVDSVETTGLSVDKRAQLLKEERIRSNGGNYIRDKVTGELIPLGDIETRIRRWD